jgi:hypothetical protein
MVGLNYMPVGKFVKSEFGQIKSKILSYIHTAPGRQVDFYFAIDNAKWTVIQ